MKDEDIQNLLGGFATDTLTDVERERLYAAALKNQELFDALADEQALRELLSDPVSRRELLEALEPQTSGIFTWMRRPAFWAVALVAMTTLLAVGILRQARPPATQIAQALLPKPVPPAVARMEDRNQPESKPATRRVVMKAEKMKLAVLDFDSGSAVKKEADVGKAASDLLGKKLGANGYTVIDRKRVDEALQAQNLTRRQLDSSTAASVGRSLGADAVIVGSVRAAPETEKSSSGGGGAGVRALAPRQAKSQDTKDLQVSATAINTQTSSNFAEAAAQGGQSTQQSVLVDAVNQVASSLGQQIQQNSRAKVIGTVTEVNAGIITLDAGAKTGIKVGDKFELRRDGKPVGRIVIHTVRDASSVGAFQGDGPAKIGDSLVSQ
jgi:Curli production assembly/transport component CsgG